MESEDALLPSSLEMGPLAASPFTGERRGWPRGALAPHLCGKQGPMLHRVRRSPWARVRTEPPGGRQEGLLLGERQL